MFVSIKGTLQQKEKSLQQQSSVAVVVRQVVESYLRETYPTLTTTISVRYQPEERLVVISTPSKSLAGELTMQAGDIRAHLTAHKIRVERIIVR